MKRYFIFMAIIFGMIAPSVSAQTVKKKVAVYMTGNDVDESYKKIIGAKFVSTITATDEYAAVERTADFLAALSSEQDYQASGEVRDNQIARIGQRFGVRYVVVADVTELFDELFIASRMINVETGLVEKAFEANGPYGDNMSQLIDIATKVANGLMRVRDSQTSSVSKQSSFSGQDFVETTAGLNMKMIYVEGGEFMMGATSEQGSEGYDNEQVIRRVKLDSYYIGECEVTQDQWQKVMGVSLQQKVSEGTPFAGVGPDYPMYYVTWEEAQVFCKELSRMTGKTYCLPTEAQWEYAARGGKKADDTKYSGSWSIDAVAWYDGNSGSSTHPVKNKRPNELGLYDMSGNVFEWCSDWYSDNYNMNDTNNPVGPSSGGYRVLRGGCYHYGAKYCRISFRGYDSEKRSFSIYGFRVVLLP